MKSIAYLILFILLIPSFWWLLGSGYFNMHDDLQVMRFFQMNKCFLDGQIPCRWSPDMVWGYGQAMFNFYSAFPYYLGTLLHMVFPLTYLSTVKIVFLISFIIAGFGMYKLAKEFWGKLGGLLSAVLYTYAPYHALDIYVRGAMSESYALSLLPWMWYFTYRLIKKYSLTDLVGTSVSIALILMTHNISTMLYAPITLIWCVYWIVLTKDLKSTYRLIFAGSLGVGLASFFIIPAVFEQNIIQTKLLTLEYYDFKGHFVSLRQLFFDRSWGDGPSIYGDFDDISFQVGWPHWWLGILAFFNLIYLKLKRKAKNGLLFLISVLAVLTALTSFLTHSRSLYIWELIPQMNFVQFPWRILGLVMFFLSFLAGSIGYKKGFVIKSFIVFTILLTIVLNFNYFIPVQYSRLVTEESKLSGLAFELQQKAATLDYLPKTARTAPVSKAFEKPKVLEGDASVSILSVRSDSFSFDADVYNSSFIEIPVMYFPGWKVFVDDKETEINIHGDYGLIAISLEDGRHSVYGKFTNTPIRSVSNAVSLFSIGILMVVMRFGDKYEEKDKRPL